MFITTMKLCHVKSVNERTNYWAIPSMPLVIAKRSSDNTSGLTISCQEEK
jgi:hypothetical protein